MSYLLLTIISGLIAIGLLYFALKILGKSNWFFGWIRGMFGLFILLGFALFACAAWDIYSYRQVLSEENIATISFTELDPQQYAAVFTDKTGNTQNFELKGDQWQLDTRIIKWNGVFSLLGMKTGYRLDRLNGRYLSLEDERNKPRTVYTLIESPIGVDVWEWVKSMNLTQAIDARYGNSTFLPMVDGGQYQISVSNTGLLARPLNQPAKDAVDQWR